MWYKITRFRIARVLGCGVGSEAGASDRELGRESDDEVATEKLRAEREESGTGHHGFIGWTG